MINFKTLNEKLELKIWGNQNHTSVQSIGVKSGFKPNKTFI